MATRLYFSKELSTIKVPHSKEWANTSDTFQTYQLKEVPSEIFFGSEPLRAIMLPSQDYYFFRKRRRHSWNRNGRMRLR